MSFGSIKQHCISKNTNLAVKIALKIQMCYTEWQKNENDNNFLQIKWYYFFWKISVKTPSTSLSRRAPAMGAQASNLDHDISDDQFRLKEGSRLINIDCINEQLSHKSMKETNNVTLRNSSEPYHLFLVCYECCKIYFKLYIN